MDWPCLVISNGERERKNRRLLLQMSKKYYILLSFRGIFEKSFQGLLVNFVDTKFFEIARSILYVKNIGKQTLNISSSK